MFAIQNQQLVKLLFPLTEVKLVGDETKIYLIRKGLIDKVWRFSYLLSLTFLYHSPVVEIRFLGFSVKCPSTPEFVRSY